MPSGRWPRHAAVPQPSDRRLDDLDDHEHEEGRDEPRGEGLELAVPVGVVVVGRLAGDADADERGDVRERVGERVEAVREDADRAAVVAVASSLAAATSRLRTSTWTRTRVTSR